MVKREFNDRIITDGLPDGWGIQDRLDEGCALLIRKTPGIWPGSTCICLKPAAITTDEWLSVARRIALGFDAQNHAPKSREATPAPAPARREAANIDEFVTRFFESAKPPLTEREKQIAAMAMGYAVADITAPAASRELMGAVEQSAIDQKPIPAQADGGVHQNEDCCTRRSRGDLPETRGPYEARHCPGSPADCCDYGVVSLSEGIEVCRVWRERDARAIAAALDTPPALPRGDGTGGWTLSSDALHAIRADAGEWAEEAYLETIEAVALATERYLARSAPVSTAAHDDYSTHRPFGFSCGTR